MENRNEQDADERSSAVYNNVKRLYEEAKRLWKGVLFEIQLDPLDPESEDQSERHTIDFRHCLPNDIDDDRHLTLEELFREIERLQDYKSLLDSALQAIDLVREECKDTYQVTFLRILQLPLEQQNEVEIDSESDETISEEELESDEEFEPELEPEWQSDSGNGSVSQDSQEESEYDSTCASDSGMQTELESDIEVDPEWELEQSFEEEHELQPEHQLAPFFGLNSDTDSDEEVSTSGATCNDSGDEEEANHQQYYEYPKIDYPNAEILILGPNATRISRSLYEAIPWKNAAETTRGLLELVFNEDILATYTLNSRILGINRWAPGKNQLNPEMIDDIISLICFKYNVNPQEVRNAIESKCADMCNA